MTRRVVGALLRALVALALAPLYLVAQGGVLSQPIPAPAFLDSAYAYDLACARPSLDSAQYARAREFVYEDVQWLSITTPLGVLPVTPNGTPWYAMTMRGLDRVFVAAGYERSRVIVAHELMHALYVTATGDTTTNAHPDAFFRRCKLDMSQYVRPVDGFNDAADNDRRLLTARLW